MPTSVIFACRDQRVNLVESKSFSKIIRGNVLNNVCDPKYYDVMFLLSDFRKYRGYQCVKSGFIVTCDAISQEILNKTYENVSDLTINVESFKVYAFRKTLK